MQRSTFERTLKGGKRMSSYVLGFEDIDKTKIIVVGGKGASLGEVSKVEGIVPPKLLRESLGKRRRLTNYLISYRF
jgi:pyruvate,water dikinase